LKSCGKFFIPWICMRFLLDHRENIMNENILHCSNSQVLCGRNTYRLHCTYQSNWHSANNRID
jgi:hypothetical protein